MAKPLRLCIKPPYADWTLIHCYGPEVPQPAAGPLFHHETLLRVTGAVPVAGELFAACAGSLSARPPQVPGQDAAEEIQLPTDQQPLPAAVTLYLHLDVDNALQVDLQNRSNNIHHIRGFMYQNIDLASLELKLAELLDDAVFPPGSATRTQTVEMLVRGTVNVTVPAGRAIGNACTEGTIAGSRQFGFTMISDQGPFDASYAYDWMRDYVEDGQPDIDAYLNLAPKKWPIIDSVRTDAQVITDTESSLFSMTVFDQLRRDHPTLTAANWRKIGKNQKDLYRARLLKRVGHAPANSTDPPFEFDDKDAKNIFQLEAVVEFYANFEDPWLAGAVPRPTNDAAYVTIDLLDPQGTAATPGISPNQLHLDDPFVAAPGLAAYQSNHLNRIRVNKDTIYLDADTNVGRPSRIYTITAVNAATRTVTLDASPQLSGGTSAWRITLRPVVIIIDAHGGRLKGDTATVPNAGQPTVVLLDRLPAIPKINEYFDTIYLPSDTARPSRTYRIRNVDAGAHTVTLDGQPTLSGGAGNSSKWHIPSGLSGELIAVPYTLGPGTVARGWDHYHGTLFVVQSDAVKDPILWTSYTSRDYESGNEYLSSIKGNAKYDFASVGSPPNPDHPNGPPFRNYCFSIKDPGAAYDGVRRARFYFGENVTEDTAIAPAWPNVLGKTGIRLHMGNSTKNSNNELVGCGSAGCLVSPSFRSLRDLLIDLYKHELALRDAPRDAEVQKAHGLNLADSKALWHNSHDTDKADLPPVKRLLDGNWANKIVGTMWLIRPDERPS